MIFFKQEVKRIQRNKECYENRIEMEDFNMGLSFEDTFLAKYLRKEGIEQGEKQKALEIAAKLLKKGFSVEEVADDTGLDVEEVRDMQDR